MKSYSVKQIAEIMGTNPETVRRWIRDGKLKAVQSSRKGGNVVKEADLERFGKTMPKYFPRISAGIGLAAIAPIAAAPAIASTIMASAFLGYFESKKRTDVRIRLEDFKNYLRNNVAKLKGAIMQKQALIQQTEEEIKEISNQIEQYSYLLENESLLADTLGKATTGKDV